MPHKIHAIIFTQVGERYEKIRDAVKKALEETGLIEHETYFMSACYNRPDLEQTLQHARASDDAILLATEPSTRRGESVISLVEQHVRSNPENADGVILLILEGYFLRRLPVNRNQVIRSLDEDGLKRFAGLVRNFVKHDIKRGLTDYNRFATQLENYKRDWCTPLPPSSPSQSNASGDVTLVSQVSQVSPEDALVQANAQRESPADIRHKWLDFAEEIKVRANQLLEDAQSTKLTKDDPKVATIHALLHLWVEAQLYALRAYSNYEVYNNASKALLDRPDVTTLERIPPGFGISQKRFSVRNDVHHIVQAYQTKLREFDAALRNTWSERKPFTKRFGDAEQFRSWSKEFGQDKISPDIEPGWEIQATSAERELYFHYREALRREHWLAGRSISAIIMWIFKFIAGYGFHPEYTAYITLFAILGFGALHGLDDFGSGCVVKTSHTETIQTILEKIQYYFSVSVSSLTSLGSVTTPCGRFHGVLLASETLFGYFLLAILTTLFVQSLSDR
jgi:hypothetical protein